MVSWNREYYYFTKSKIKFITILWNIPNQSLINCNALKLITDYIFIFYQGILWKIYYPSARW